ncbi:MAG: HlyD family efflux transporter periplasmic adaptor subunit [Isosphaeraceae bacterium]
MTPLSAGPPNIINASDAANHHVSSVMISGSAQGIVRWLILAAVLSQAACSWQPESMLSANRGAAVDLKVTAERINALGRVEPKGGLISITGVPGARIGEISVCEGQVVGANAKLFVLDNYRELDANCEMIEAQRAEAKTLLDLETQSEALLREDLDVEEAQIQQLDPYDRLAQGLKVEALRDAGENARIDSDRLIRLKEAGSSLVSQQEIDAQKLKVRSAKAELDEAEALLKKFDQAQKIARRKIEIQRRRAAIAAEKGRLAARIKSLEASHRAALIQWDQAVVHAVLAGRILRILSRPGETISAQPVLQMGDTSAMDVVAEVSELQARDLGRAGPVTMTALGETLHGTIDLEKSRRMVGRNSLFSLDPTVDADRRVILVRIRLDQRSSQMVADLTNLQVDVEIPLGPPRRVEPVGSAPADASTVNPPQPPS